MSASAVVLLSGGLDSATVLALAREQGYACHALTVAYGQRHGAELQAAALVAAAGKAISHRTLAVDLGALGGSALTDASIPVPVQRSTGIPSTYVPARNTVFLALALACAEVVGAQCIYLGVNAVDYSGYPDCRPAFVDAFAQLAAVATRATAQGGTLRIEAPLLHWSKAEIIRAGVRLGVDYAMTVSCYAADAAGRACARCDACVLRADGFAAAGVADPTRYQA